MSGVEASGISHNLVGFEGGSQIGLVTLISRPEKGREWHSAYCVADCSPLLPETLRGCCCCCAPGWVYSQSCFLQAHLSWHSASQSPSEMPTALKSAHTHSSHLSGGLPRFARLLTPCKDEKRATCGSLPGSMRPTCPNHLSLLADMIAARVVDHIQP